MVLHAHSNFSGWHESLLCCGGVSCPFFVLFTFAFAIFFYQNPKIFYVLCQYFQRKSFGIIFTFSYFFIHLKILLHFFFLIVFNFAFYEKLFYSPAFFFNDGGNYVYKFSSEHCFWCVLQFCYGVLFSLPSRQVLISFLIKNYLEASYLIVKSLIYILLPFNYLFLLSLGSNLKM